MSVGGKVVQYCRDIENKRMWVNTLDSGEYCGVHVPEGTKIHLNDILWWQNGRCFWSREGRFTDVEVDKLSSSGVKHPLGPEYEVRRDFYPTFKYEKSKNEILRTSIEVIRAALEQEDRHIVSVISDAIERIPQSVLPRVGK